MHSTCVCVFSCTYNSMVKHTYIYLPKNPCLIQSCFISETFKCHMLHICIMLLIPFMLTLAPLCFIYAPCISSHLSILYAITKHIQTYTTLHPLHSLLVHDSILRSTSYSCRGYTMLSFTIMVRPNSMTL